MKSTRGIVLIMALSLILTGCFRQASEPFESVDNADTDGAPQNIQETPVPQLATATDEMLSEETPETEPTTFVPLPTEALETPTEAGVTQSDVTDTGLPTLGAPVTSTQLALPTNTIAVVVPPTNTAAPNVTDTNADTTSQQDTDTVDAAPTFITPGAVQGENNNTEDNTNTQTTPAANVQPSATPSGLITPTDFLNPENLPQECYYIVQNGDNLFRISVNNGVTLDELRRANPQVQGDIIQPGDQLIIPLPTCTGETTSDAPAAEATPAAPTTNQTIHSVSSGETLGQIARRYGTTIDAIVQANNLTNPDRLSIGQQLVIPSQ